MLTNVKLPLKIEPIPLAVKTGRYTEQLTWRDAATGKLLAESDYFEPLTINSLRPLYRELIAGRGRHDAVATSGDRSLSQREHAFLLREAGLHELLRSEGWEDVVARLQAENEALRRRSGA